MTAKTARYSGKIFAALFTSVVAPLLVHFVQEIPVEEIRSVVTPLEPRAGAAPQATEVVHVIACGAGRTPEMSLRDALHTALRQAVAARIGSRNDWAFADRIERDADDLILRWRELATRKEWNVKGLVYHKEVAVEVNGRALADRLTALALQP